ncbi:MAG: NAD(+)/NADH kinase, partial [Planctomycetes bacterium]|nr:NAD(+)/NADH kinase [Planctomycetota bacterium]
MRQINSWGAQSTIRIVFEDKLRPYLTTANSLPRRKLIDESDAILVLGGDGTILTVVSDIGDSCKPVLAVNLGHLGFLTETPVNKMIFALECLQKNEFKLEQRLIIRAEIRRKSELVKHLFALNEVVVSKGSYSRIIELEMYVGDEFVSTYTADGIIIATPTGSTGYSLSAGSPIVAPHMGALIATPICAHTLAVRPLIISDREIFRVRIKSNIPNIVLTADGREDFQLEHYDEVIVSRAHYEAT